MSGSIAIILANFSCWARQIRMQNTAEKKDKQKIANERHGTRSKKRNSSYLRARESSSSACNRRGPAVLDRAHRRRGVGSLIL